MMICTNYYKMQCGLRLQYEYGNRSYCLAHVHYPFLLPLSPHPSCSGLPPTVTLDIIA
jgi:hypothetical protein